MDETPEKALCRKLRRFERRGESRKAFVTLREAALKNEDDAALWVRYGVQCLRMGKREVGQQAIRHAAWLRERANQDAKARVTRRLLEQHDQTLAA